MGAKKHTLDERILLNEKLQPYLQPYYENGGKKLIKLVDEILIRLKYYDVARDEFVSLADEIIVNAMYDYDFKQDFNGYIYRCLENKFKTEMTRRNRYKRQADKMALSLEEKVGNDDKNVTIGELIADKNTVESEIFKERKEEWRREVKEYLEKLSPLQRKIAFLMSDNNTPDEICEELHITMKHFENSLKRILSDERIKILRPIVERN